MVGHWWQILCSKLNRIESRENAAPLVYGFTLRRWCMAAVASAEACTCSGKRERGVLREGRAGHSRWAQARHWRRRVAVAGAYSRRLRATGRALLALLDFATAAGPTRSGRPGARGLRWAVAAEAQRAQYGPGGRRAAASLATMLSMLMHCNSRRVVTFTVTVDTRQMLLSADFYRGIYTIMYNIVCHH